MKQFSNTFRLLAGTSYFPWPLIFALFLLTGTAYSQTMVKDINTVPSGSFPSHVAVMNNVLYFQADNGINGNELWMYDGVNPPSMVMDILPGMSGSFPSNMAVMNNVLYFAANNGVNGTELWKYTGTGSPVMVADIYSGSTGSNPSGLAVMNNVLYFAADEGINGIELWKYNGTNPPSMVANVNSGSNSFQPAYMTELNSVLYFSAVSGGSYGFWKYDGVNTPSLVSSTPVSGIMRWNNALYFSGSMSSVLYKYDGSSMTSVGGPTYPAYMTEFNGALYFQGGPIGNNELWKYDGINTPSLVYEINASGDGFPSYLKVMNNKLYFSATNGVDGKELWQYDGEAAPSMVANLNSGAGNFDPANLVVINGVLYFGANNGTTGQELFKYDGVNTPSLVSNINSGTNTAAVNNLTTLNSVLYFTANDGTNGNELWKYSGTGLPSMVADIRTGTNSSANPAYLAPMNNVLYFAARDNSSGAELWRYNGSTAPSMVADIRSGSSGSSPSYMTAMNNVLYFQANSTGTNAELWKYDGTNAPSMVADLNASGSASPANLKVMNNVLYFAATNGTNGVELWRYNGSTAPSMVADINGAGDSNPSNLVVMNNVLYYAATNGIDGVELWKYNGVNAPSMVANINASGSSSPAYLTVMNNVLYFAATNGTNGTELWKYDGVNAPSMAAELLAGASGSNPAHLCVMGGILYFSATNGASGDELWKYDGISTPSLIGNINTTFAGAGSSSPAYLTAINDRLYFSGTDGLNGIELWYTAPNMYVSPTGDDTNPGNFSATPKRTLQAAADAAFDGGTVYLSAGTYNEAATITKKLTLIPAGRPVLNELTMNGIGKTLTLTDSVAISGRLKLENGVVATSDKLVLLSDASRTAIINDFSTGYTGTLSGKIVAQRYVPGAGAGHRYVASPVSGATYSQFANIANVAYYDESRVSGFSATIDAGWVVIPNHNTTVTPIQGLSAYVTSGNVTSRLVGTANTGLFSTTVTRTNTPASTPNGGYNMLANPYPSAVAWSAIWNLNGDQSIHKTMYVWNNSQNKSAAYNFSTNASANGGTNQIAPGQSFRIRRTPQGASTFTLNNTVRRDSLNNNSFMRTEPTAKVDALLRLNLSGSDDKEGYETVIHSVADATDGLDADFDAELPDDKGIAQMYSRAGDRAMMLNALPSLGDRTVALGVIIGKEGEYTIAATEMNAFTPGTRIYLEDKKTGMVQDLTVNPSYKVFLSTSEANRFFVHFSTAAKEAGAASPDVNIFSYQDEVTVQFADAKLSKGRITVINMLGQVIEKVDNKTEQSTVRLKVDASQGAYIVRVENENGVTSKKVFISQK